MFLKLLLRLSYFTSVLYVNRGFRRLLNVSVLAFCVSRFTFHILRLTPLVEQLQRCGKALCPTLAEHVLKLST